MKNVFLRKTLLAAICIMYIFGSVTAQAYYLNVDVSGNAILTTGSFEGISDIPKDEFSNIDDSGYDIVNAKTEGLTSASAHGNVVKRRANSGGSHQFRTLNTLIGTASDKMDDSSLQAAKKVVFKTDVLVGEGLTSGYLDIRALMVEKDNKTGDLSESADGNVIRVNYGNTAPLDGEKQGSALEVMGFNGPTVARIATLKANEWYTFMIEFDVTGDDSTKFKKSVWLNEELIAEDWLPYQSSKSFGNKTIQFLNGFRVYSNDVNANVYLDNMQLWTDGVVNSLKAYDGYDVKCDAEIHQGNMASVSFSVANYMDAYKSAVAMAAIYDKKSNTVEKVSYKPLTLEIGQTVEDTIESIVLPEDYNTDDYEIRFYLWSIGEQFAPIICSISNL